MTFASVSIKSGWWPAFATLALLMAQPIAAFEVSVTHQDQPSCDPLFVPEQVDELGVAFPDDELIRSRDSFTELAACQGQSPSLVNRLLEITNLTSRTFSELWYVTDPDTTISNVDGLVNGQPAFRIDSAISDPGGANLPLIFESGGINDIFEPGETWRFVIDDYSNAFLPPSALASVGLVGSFSATDTFSSGSIIAIPEPSCLAMAIFVFGCIGVCRRSSTSRVL